MSKNAIVSAITLSFAFISSSAFSDEPPYVPREVIVQFAPKAGGEYPLAGESEAIVASACRGVVKDISRFVAGSMLVKIPDDLSVEDAVRELRNTSGVLHVQPNYIYRAFSTFPNDLRGPTPDGGDQWGLHNTGQTGGTPDADIDAPEAWDIATDSNIIVAVIDSGVDYTHPDLVANMWTDSNGYHGYDFCNNDNDPMDDYGHGTHCAGIIGAISS
jgi:subtilisin family serine protease